MWSYIAFGLFGLCAICVVLLAGTLRTIGPRRKENAAKKRRHMYVIAAVLLFALGVAALIWPEVTR
jgi:Na+-transporting NADH:ubiquinone oxidoreductase subunit NqrC